MGIETPPWQESGTGMGNEFGGGEKEGECPPPRPIGIPNYGHNDKSSYTQQIHQHLKVCSQYHKSYTKSCK